MRLPLLPGQEGGPERRIGDAEVAIEVAHDCLRHHFRDLLRNHADIELIAPQIAEAIEPDAVRQLRDLDNVTLEANVRRAEVGALPADDHGAPKRTVTAIADVFSIRTSVAGGQRAAYVFGKSGGAQIHQRSQAIEHFV